ncbi:MAG: ABC transporter ATP-binding protein [Treponema sp.]|jgi:ABC-2 type transport system ATP-binding protein|nr:ABC transporter ATP-binding protein [Treponema sp.]
MKNANILEIRNLSKSFGANKVIDNISFDVPEGSIFGFIGANGAGKTTTMNMILGFLETDSGGITACGEKVSYGKTVKSIGYLPDVPEFYNYMRPMEYLSLCGELSGMPKAKIMERGKELLELVGLSKANRKIGGFSRGMKQRLGIIQALLGEPNLLICDEPTSALDPMGRKEILDILIAVRGKTTVIFSTHILNDVERICDRVAFLHKGKIVLESAISDLKVQHKSKSITLEFEQEVDSDEVIRLLGQNNIIPSRVETGEICLESLYLELAKQ